MKNFLIIFSLIFVFGCSSYSQSKKIIYDCSIEDTINQEEKFINVEKYKNDLYKNGGFTLFENDTLLIDVSLNNNSLTKRTENKKTHIIKAIQYDEISKKIISYEFYYTKGNFNIGKEYYYDSLGKITKTINNDDPENYTLCYKEAEAIVLKKMGKKYEIYVLVRENKIINNEKIYYWEVITSKIGSFKYADKREFWIHGKTGKIIKILKLRVSTDDYFPDKK
jgi:hypothetical protein